MTANPAKSKSRPLTDQERQEAVNLYVGRLMTLPEVADCLGRPMTTIARWLNKVGATRRMPEAFAIAIQKGRKRLGGDNYPWQSAKAGGWVFADSRWEVVRMSQLDGDDSVDSWSRSVDRVPYVGPCGSSRFYVPDIIVYYKNGDVCVEEIKPKNLVGTPVNVAKALAAKQFFFARGASYRILTEDDIGAEAISNFQFDGLKSPCEKLRAERRKEMRAAAEKRRSAARNREKLSVFGSVRHSTSIQARAIAVAAYVRGESLAKVASNFSVSTSTIRNWLISAGVERRPDVCGYKSGGGR